MYLCIYLSIYLICLSDYVSDYLSTYLSTYLSYLPIYLIYLSTHLPIYLSLSLCLSVCLSIYLSICKLENEAVLRDDLRFWTWQHQKRSNSAWLPHFSKLTPWKTRQFCETSSFFEVDNMKNEAILRDFFIFEVDNMKNEAILRDFFNFWTWQHHKPSNSARLPSKVESWVQSWWPRTNAFCDVSTPPV